MESDPLGKLLKFYPKPLVDYGLISKVFFIVANLYLGVFQFMGFYEVIAKMDVNFLKKYLIYFGGTIVFEILTVSISKANQHFLNLPKITKKYKINLDSIDNTTTQIDIQKISNKIYKVSSIWAASNAIALIAFLPVLGDESEWLLPAYYMKKLNHKYLFNLFAFTNHCLAAFAIYLVANCIAAFIYINGHLQIQSLILKKLILKCSKIINGEDCHQRDTYNALRDCVIAESLIRRMSDELHKMSRPAMILMYFSGLSMVAFMTSMIVLKKNPESMLKMELLFCCYPATVAVFCDSFQQFINEYEKAYQSLLRLPWFKWNAKNKKMYIMLLQIMQNPPEVQPYYGDKIRYTTIIYIARIFYAALNILIKLS